AHALIEHLARGLDFELRRKISSAHLIPRSGWCSNPNRVSEIIEPLQCSSLRRAGAHGRAAGTRAASSGESDAQGGARDPGKGGSLLREGVEVRFRFIDAEKARHPVEMLCRLMQVSRSGFYAWRTRAESARARANRALLCEIREIHQASRGVYGSPRVWFELKARGQACGRHRVARLMRED